MLSSYTECVFMKRKKNCSNVKLDYKARHLVASQCSLSNLFIHSNAATTISSQRKKQNIYEEDIPNGNIRQFSILNGHR